jgi:hypothetical protein
MTDARFVFDNPPRWQQGQHQKLQGTEFITIPASTKSSTLYEFELPNSNSVFLFGPLSGFKVKGVFEQKLEGATEYTAIPADQYPKVQLQPNWFENLIKSIDVFNNNASVKCDDVPRYADHVLNTYLYANMDKDVLEYLAPHHNHPARCVPVRTLGFPATANSEWHEYSKHVFGKPTFEFRYVPMFVFPFYQHAYFGAAGGKLPNALPMALLEKLRISISLKEDTKCIFKKLGDAATVEANKTDYRFRLISIDLIVEEARLQTQFERLFTKKSGPVYFNGITRYGRVENISPATLTHRTEIKNIDYPEGIFIFALNKKVIGGEFTYTDVAAPSTSPVFVNTNIESVDITFNGLPLAVKVPNIGTIRDQTIEIKSLMDHKEAPPFGIPQDPHLLSMLTVMEAGERTSYPHVYMNLCPSLKETRLIGIGDDGKGINTPGNLELNIKFKPPNGSADATYYIYLFHTDTNMILDPRTKSLTPYYKRVRPSH